MQEEAQKQEEESTDLLYQAVAVSLNKETVTEADLQDVERIIVIGNKVYGASEQFDVDNMIYRDEEYINNGDYGPISDLSLLAKMPNLSEVYLYNQQISDISVLEGLPICKLYLSNNMIEDFRVLEKLPQLRELFISKNPIRYLPDFSKCRRLMALVMNENSVANLDCLRNSFIEQMGIHKLNVANNDYTFLEELPMLDTLFVWNPKTELLEEMIRLGGVRQVGLFDYHGENLDFLPEMQKIEELHIRIQNALDLSPLESLPYLSSLSISCQQISDISIVSKLPNLGYLCVHQTSVTDLSILSQCENLVQVIVNQEQADDIEKRDKQHSYDVIITE